MDQPTFADAILPQSTGPSPGRVRRVLEIALVCGSLVGAGVLGGIAIFSSPSTGARAASGTPSSAAPTAVSSADATRIVNDLAECLRAAGLQVQNTSAGAPPAIGALSVVTPEGGFALMVVFPTVDQATESQATLAPDVGPAGELRQVGRVLVAYATPPPAGGEASIQECASATG